MESRTHKPRRLASGPVERWARKALTQPEGASPWPGPWKPRHPAYRAVLDAVGRESWRRLVVQGSTQSGKTELLAVLAGYYAHVEGAPVLIYTGAMGLKAALAKRLREFYRAARDEALAEAYAREKPPYVRTLPGGGSITVLSSTEQTAFQSRSARVVILDEVRSHPASLVLAAESRQAAWTKRDPKTIAVSSAAPRPPCRITELLERSDYRTWRFPAPCCGAEIPADWSLVDGYGEDPELAFFACPRCDARMDSPAFKDACSRGRFTATRTAADKGSLGFHIPEQLSPAVPLAEQARKHTSALVAYRNTGQDRELQDFHADALAATYRDVNTTIDPEAARVACKARYNPDAFLPAGVACITMSCDTQDDRLEVEIAGWGAVEVAQDAATKLNLERRHGWQSWRVGDRFFRLLRYGIAYRVLPGSPDGDEVWQALNELRARRYKVGSPDGPELRAGLCLVDAGGHHTERVRAWSRSTDHTGAACKGASRPGQPLARTAHTRDITAEYGATGLTFVGTDAAKDIVLGCVRRSTLAADLSWCWPDDESAHGYDWRYFAGLCGSEQRMMVTSKITGFATSRYVKHPSVANEPLDLAVYNLSAVALIGLPRLIQNAAALRLVKGAA
ncbi:MAG: phage terminase large subunit family protein [Deltaproteobacteria bacterium]|nr:phage terminase large subunit family protein [Deltaproteobacteria bacterium]